MLEDRKLREATMSYLFAYFEAADYKIRGTLESNILDRLADCTEESSDINR